MPDVEVHAVRGGTNCTRDRLCRHCHRALPEGRKTAYCTGCRRAYLARRAAVPGRRCSDCGLLLPEGRLSGRCSDCDRQRHRWYDRARPGRQCATCRAALPETRAQRYCRACARARRQARYGSGQFPCTGCGAIIVRRGWQQPRCGECLELARFLRRLKEKRTVNRTKTITYPTPPPQASIPPGAGRMPGQMTARTRRSDSQQAAGARARAMKRDVARKNGASPYNCD